MGTSRSPKGLKRDAARGVFWTGVQTLGSRLVSMLVFAVLAHLLEPRAFGVVALASVAVAFTTVFVEQGLGQALVQRIDLEPGHCVTAFWASLASSLGLAGALVAVAGPLASLLGQAQFGPVLRVLALALPVSALSSVPQALFQRQLAFRVLAERAILANLIGGAAGVAAAFSGLDVWSLVAQTLIGSVAGSLLLWLKTTWRPRGRPSAERFRELFSFGWKVMGSSLLGFATRNSDNLLIGAVLGPIALGVYAIAYRIFEVMTEVSTRTVAMVSFPVFAQVQEDRDRLERGLLDATQMCVALALPCATFTAVLAPDIVPVLFGSQWRESVPVMQVLASIGALFPMLFLNTSVIQAMGESGWVLRIAALNAICVVSGFAIAVHWGIVAVAASYAISAYILCPVSILVARRLVEFDLSTYALGLVGPAAATLCVALPLAAVRTLLATTWPSVAILALLIPAGCAGYLGALRLANPRALGHILALAKAALPSLGGPEVAAPGTR